MTAKREEIKDEFKWNLEQMYKDENTFSDDFSKVEDNIVKLSEYKGKIFSSFESFKSFFELYESTMRKMQKLYVYSHMKSDENTKETKNQSRSGKTDILSNKVSTSLSFIVPEIISTDEKIIGEYTKEEFGSKYKRYLNEILRKKPYTLSLEEEKILALSSDMANTCEEAFKMFSYADMQFPNIKDEEGNDVQLSHGNFIKYMQSKDQRVRKDAFEALYSTYRSFKNFFASTLYGSLKREIFYSNARGYENPLMASLYQDNIDVCVYDNLIDEIHSNLEPMYEYMRLKKEFLKLDEIHMYDLYVPIVEEFDMEISYDEAKTILLEAFKPLGEDYIKLIKKAFDEKWIDVYENEGKKGGAYSWGCFDSHPYILMNYKDNLNSLFTLAHELGHSVHSYYSRTTQNYIDSQYKIFVAEVASTLNEQLLMDYMLKRTKDKKEKLYLLNYYLEQFRTTVYRQTMFAEFEKIVHEKVMSGQSLTNEDFSSIYYGLNKLYYGEDIVVDEDIEMEWARIPHFYSNFYVYKYATGFSAASALSSDILKGNEESTSRYIEFLKSGGSDYPIELLKKAGVDMNERESINRALCVFKGLVDQLKGEL